MVTANLGALTRRKDARHTSDRRTGGHSEGISRQILGVPTGRGPKRVFDCTSAIEGVLPAISWRASIYLSVTHGAA